MTRIDGSSGRSGISTLNTNAPDYSTALSSARQTPPAYSSPPNQAPPSGFLNNNDPLLNNNMIGGYVPNYDELQQTNQQTPPESPPQQQAGQQQTQSQQQQPQPPLTPPEGTTLTTPTAPASPPEVTPPPSPTAVPPISGERKEQFWNLLETPGYTDLPQAVSVLFDSNFTPQRAEQVVQFLVLDLDLSNAPPGSYSDRIAQALVNQYDRQGGDNNGRLNGNEVTRLRNVAEFITPPAPPPVVTPPVAPPAPLPTATHDARFDERINGLAQAYIAALDPPAERAGQTGALQTVRRNASALSALTNGAVQMPTGANEHSLDAWRNFYRSVIDSPQFQALPMGNMTHIPGTNMNIMVTQYTAVAGDRASFTLHTESSLSTTSNDFHDVIRAFQALNNNLPSAESLETLPPDTPPQIAGERHLSNVLAQEARTLAQASGIPLPAQLDFTSFTNWLSRVQASSSPGLPGNSETRNYGEFQIARDRNGRLTVSYAG